MDEKIEWCGIIINNSPFRYYTPYQDVFTSIIDNDFGDCDLGDCDQNKFIRLTDVYTESIEGRELRLIKWQAQSPCFQGIVPIRVDHITSICKIQRNSRFENLLNGFKEDPSLEKVLIKTL